MPRPTSSKSKAIRSGRFNYEKNVVGGTIIRGKTQDRAYRFFNAGQAPFSVNVNGATYNVPVNCSIDLPVYTGNGNGSVEIQKANNVDDVSGVYEALTDQTEIRSGRFQYLRPAQESTNDIVVDSDKSIYRFWNSGEIPVTVKANGNDKIVAPNCSLDLYVKNGNVAVKSVAGGIVQGVYDRLNPKLIQDIRSGQFKSDANPAAVTIVDFMVQGAATTCVYRIYNSGANDFEVFQGNDSLGTVRRSSSLEFEFPGIGTKSISIKPLNNRPFEGSYELLGGA